MGKGLGISALVVGLLAIFIPVVTIYVIWLSLILAAIAGFLGDKVFPIVALFANMINIIFLSPMTLIALKGENLGGGSFLMISTIMFFVLPVITLVISAKKRKSLVTA